MRLDVVEPTLFFKLPVGLLARSGRRNGVGQQAQRDGRGQTAQVVFSLPRAYDVRPRYSPASQTAPSGRRIRTSPHRSMLLFPHGS